MTDLPVFLLDSRAKLPTRSEPDAAGLDLYSMGTVVLMPHVPVKVGTGCAMAIPAGYYGQIHGRSGLSAHGIDVLGGVVDSGYRGEVAVVLVNTGCEMRTLQAGDRIAQMVILSCAPLFPKAVAERSQLGDTVRGEKGFASSGR